MSARTAVRTGLQITTCHRRSENPSAVTAETPQNGLEITAGRRAVIKGSSRRWLHSSPWLRPGLQLDGLYVYAPPRSGQMSASAAMMLVRLRRSAADWWWTRQLRFLPVTSCAGSPR